MVSDTVLRRAAEDEQSDGSSNKRAPRSFDADEPQVVEVEEENVFDQILDKRSQASRGSENSDEEEADDGIVLKEGQVAHTDGMVVVSAKPLNEPRIYANRLLGRKVNI